jgi:asparagine synthase (glutamine-hydrolysing)
LSESEWIDSFREIWLATVKRHLLADVPVGSFLSGGIDSSAVTAAMARLSSQPVTAFTIGFPDRRYDETPYARSVAQHLGCEHVHEVVDLQRAVDILPQVQKCYDEPFADSSAISVWYLSRLAARRVKAVLAGDGGDEVFAGYRRHRTEAFVAQLSKVPRPLRQLGAAAAKLPPLPFRKWNYLRQRAERIWASSQLDDAFCRFFEKTEITTPDFREQIYLPQFLQQLEGRNSYEVRRNEVFGNSGELASQNPVEQFLFADTTVQLPALLTKVDRASMAHSLEVRVPFLSHKLVEWAATVPLEMKLRGATGKYLVRKAIEPWLPKDILNRPKQGFQAPLADWFVGGFGTFAREIWFDSGAAQAGYLSASSVESAFREHQTGQRDRSNFLYGLAQFGLWWGSRQASQPAIARTA